MQRPYFIGIAGGSCSGKTTLAGELEVRLGAGQTARISLDAYYHGLPRTDREAIERYNFDDPGALDLDLLVAHLRGLADGRAVDIPVYDFKTHKRTARTLRIDPLRFIILEGLFTLHWHEVRSLLDTKVFIDADPGICLSRRLQRDMVERARPRDEVIHRYQDMARPMFEKYIGPSRRYADVIVDGGGDIAQIAATVLEHIDANAG